MTSPLSSQTSHTLKNNHPLRGSPISKHPYVTCHIVCQPRSLPPRHRPTNAENATAPSNCRPPPLKERKRKGPWTTHTALSRS